MKKSEDGRSCLLARALQKNKFTIFRVLLEYLASDELQSFFENLTLMGYSELEQAGRNGRLDIVGTALECSAESVRKIWIQKLRNFLAGISGCALELFINGYEEREQDGKSFINAWRQRKFIHQLLRYKYVWNNLPYILSMVSPAQVRELLSEQNENGEKPID